MQHKKVCKVIPPDLDINLDLPDWRDEGFNDTDQAPEGNQPRPTMIQITAIWMDLRN